MLLTLARRLLLALLLGPGAGAGCGGLDVSAPIALLPEGDWSSEERMRLEHAAECWNLEFGTQLLVDPPFVCTQQVTVGFAELVCLLGDGGRADLVWPPSIHLCRRRADLAIVMHELGHMLNIMEHTEHPSVMDPGGGGVYQGHHGLFTTVDRRAFWEANEGARLHPTCQVKLPFASDDFAQRCECIP